MLHQFTVFIRIPIQIASNKRNVVRSDLLRFKGIKFAERRHIIFRHQVIPITGALIAQIFHFKQMKN